MDLVVEMWKNARLRKRRCFPTIPTTEKDLVIDKWKNTLPQCGAYFPTYQQPDDDKFLIYEMK
jgi:hypothetical protein